MKTGFNEQHTGSRKTNFAVIGQLFRRVALSAAFIVAVVLNNPGALLALHLPSIQDNRDETARGSVGNIETNRFVFLPLNRTQFAAVHVQRARRIR